MICPVCKENTASFSLTVDFRNVMDHGMTLKKSFCVCPGCYRDMLKKFQGVRKDADSDTRVQ